MSKKEEKTEKRENKKINNINSFLRTQKRTLGQRWADRVTKFAGSWAFIFILFIFIAIWMVMNTIWLIYGRLWDPYPFILLNLTLSCLAAMQAPIILMSQNRTADRDRIKAERDHIINKKAEREIKTVIRELRSLKKKK